MKNITPTSSGKSSGVSSVLNTSFIEARQTIQSHKEQKAKPASLFMTVGIPALIVGFVGLLFLTGYFQSQLTKEWMITYVVIGVFMFGAYGIIFIVYQTFRGGFERVMSIPSPKVFCVSCGKYIDDDLEWVCGYCDEAIGLLTGSFLKKCRCGKFAMSIECPHCHILNKAEPNADPRHAARSRPRTEENSLSELWGKAIEKKFTEEFAKGGSKEEQLEEVKFQVTLTQMQTELARARSEWMAAQSLTKESLSPSGSKLEQRVKARLDHKLKIHRISEKYLKKAERDHADNQKMFDIVKMAIEDSAAEELGNIE